MLSIFEMIGASFIIVQLLMFALWVLYTQQHNAGVVDWGWVVGFFLTALAYTLLGYGDTMKMIVLLFMVTVWALRLGSLIYTRLVNNPEDPRYADLRARWGNENSDFKFLILFVFQGVLVTLISLPFLLVACCSDSIWTRWEAFGILFWAVGVTGEYFADEQLRKHKEKGLESTVNKNGLWRFSRHPNYFFELIVWIGFALYAYQSSGGILAFISPIVMYIFLRYISGVPATEAQLLKSKGDAYKEYQQETSEFFPWFPKTPNENHNPSDNKKPSE